MNFIYCHIKISNKRRYDSCTQLPNFIRRIDRVNNISVIGVIRSYMSENLKCLKKQSNNCKEDTKEAFRSNTSFLIFS